MGISPLGHSLIARWPPTTAIVDRESSGERHGGATIQRRLAAILAADIAGMMCGTPDEYLTYNPNPDESRSRVVETLKLIGMV